MRTAGTITVAVTALGVDAVDGAIGDTSTTEMPTNGAVAHAVRTADANTVRATALGEVEAVFFLPEKVANHHMYFMLPVQPSLKRLSGRC